MTFDDLYSAAAKLAAVLKERDRKIVFAESCTGGLVSAALTGIAGISEWYCGSAVVYQIATKASWLEIPQNLLDDPGPVSEVVAREMATRVLVRTPQATLAISVTGHLGPNAPPALDGVVYVAAAMRGTPKSTVVKHRFSAEQTETGNSDRRVSRQFSAAMEVLRFAADQAHSL